MKYKIENNEKLKIFNVVSWSLSFVAAKSTERLEGRSVLLFYFIFISKIALLLTDVLCHLRVLRRKKSQKFTCNL